jgi:hypothetical protein
VSASTERLIEVFGALADAELTLVPAKHALSSRLLTGAHVATFLRRETDERGDASVEVEMTCGAKLHDGRLLDGYLTVRMRSSSFDVATFIEEVDGGARSLWNGSKHHVDLADLAVTIRAAAVDLAAAIVSGRYDPLPSPAED